MIGISKLKCAQCAEVTESAKIASSVNFYDVELMLAALSWSASICHLLAVCWYCVRWDWFESVWLLSRTLVRSCMAWQIAAFAEWRMYVVSRLMNSHTHSTIRPSWPLWNFL